MEPSEQCIERRRGRSKRPDLTSERRARLVRTIEQARGCLPVKRGSRRFRTRLIAVTAALASLAAVAAWLLLRTPGWYRAAARVEPDAQVVRDEIRDAAQAFSDALMVPGDFAVHLRDRQLNGWIERRAEIYPMLDQALPPPWRRPVVRFRDGVIRLAATYRGAAADIVFSLDLAVAMQPGAIVLTADSARAGAVPLPLGLLDRLLSHPIDLPPDRAWRGSPAMRGTLRDGLKIGTRAVWPNGARGYEVLNAEVRPGVLNISLRALGPAHGSGSRVHSPDDDPFRDSR